MTGKRNTEIKSGSVDKKVCSLRKNIWKYYGGAVYIREGSISMPKNFGIELKDVNSEIVSSIENHAQNNIELTLDGVFDFMKKRKELDYKHFTVAAANQSNVYQLITGMQEIKLNNCEKQKRKIT